MPPDDLSNRLLRGLSPELPPGRFLWRVLGLSLLALAPVLALYVASIPGFAAHLMQGGPAARQFLRQVVTNGVTIVVIMNAAALVILHQAATGDSAQPAPGRLIALDSLVRLGLFIGVHAVVFWGSALMFGSFGGDPMQALRVVIPTLAHAGAFGNLSGVYLYAGLLSALPLHMAIMAQAWRTTPLLRRLAGPDPGKVGLTIAALVALGGQVLLLTILARLGLAAL